MNELIQFVIAKYKEDVAWVDRLGVSTVVYDKSGEPDETDEPVSRVALPNLGRESHTYLHHIVTRYPDFPRYTAFLQGDPSDHIKPGWTIYDVAEEIERLIERGVKFKGLADFTIRCDHHGRPHNLGPGVKIPVGRLYARLFDGPVPLRYHNRAPAGLLIVDRERILLRPRELYESALHAVLADPKDEHHTGHAMERLWYIVFNGYTALNKPAYDPEEPWEPTD